MGNNLLNKVGESVRTLQGISFQNLLGISFQNLLGEIDSTLLGKLLDCTGEVAPLGCLYSAGEQSYIKTAGDACLGTSAYSAGEY